MTEHHLYFSADELRAALRQLGPTGDRAEATVAIAAETLASIIETPREDPEYGEDIGMAWTVDHYLNADAARQAGRPHVVLTRKFFDEGESE